MAMISATIIQNFNEAYHVEKTLEVVVTISGQAERIRIDALADLLGGPYSTKSYIEEDLTLHLNYPKPGASNKQSRRVWIDYDLPWTSRPTADQALEQALSFLSDRIS
jgi:hypothetical protein